jgi:hypothetical protein
MSKTNNKAGNTANIEQLSLLGASGGYPARSKNEDRQQGL